jgi:small subunit ribosomal protein S1
MATKKNMTAEIPAEEFSTGENFAEMFNQMYPSKTRLEGYVTKGTVLDVRGDFVVVGVGLKSEAHIDAREFRNDEVKPGDIVDVYVERYEGADGLLIASREKAKKEEIWHDIEKQIASNKIVQGRIVERVRGGFTVDLNGLPAFMPSSQLDVGPVRDMSSIMNKPMDFKIIKMDRLRSNLIVSRRAILEGDRLERRDEILGSIKTGDIMEGTVKNITDYGVFVDLGGVDGLLHITDISWKRVSNPNELFSVGRKIKVKVINFDHDTGRISLGLKQLEADPWQSIGSFEIGKIYKGRVTNLADYGAFINLEDGIEGLVHVSELSWTKKNVQPSKILSLGQEVNVMVLEIDREKRRISLGLKQYLPNPWKEFAEKHSVGEVMEGEVKNITEFGIFVSLGNDLDGMVHLSDIDWSKPAEEAVKAYSKGMVVKAKILEIDAEKERISLGIKQLTKDTVADTIENMRKGEVVTCIVSEVEADGIAVEVAGVRGFIKAAELSKQRSEQRPERFAVGEKVDAKITNLDPKKRSLTLSIKAREIDEEKKIIKEYGSTDTGALLGDILGAAEPSKKKSKK